MAAGAAAGAVDATAIAVAAPVVATAIAAGDGADAEAAAVGCCPNETRLPPRGSTCVSVAAASSAGFAGAATPTRLTPGLPTDEAADGWRATETECDAAGASSSLSMPAAAIRLLKRGLPAGAAADDISSHGTEMLLRSSPLLMLMLNAAGADDDALFRGAGWARCSCAAVAVLVAVADASDSSRPRRWARRTTTMLRYIRFLVFVDEIIFYLLVCCLKAVEVTARQQEIIEHTNGRKVRDLKKPERARSGREVVVRRTTKKAQLILNPKRLRMDRRKPNINF